MKIELNGKPHATKAKNLTELVTDEGLSDTKIATALNGVFVPAGARDTHDLSEGDKVEIVAARQGG